MLAGPLGATSLVDEEREAALKAIEPTQSPTRVVLTVSDDPCTTVTLTWRTDYQSSGSRVEVVEASADPEFDREEKAMSRATATTTPFTTPDGHGVFIHSATVKGLKPGTAHAWRLLEKRGYSEWNHFRTAAQDAQPFRFLYFGDAQNSLDLRWPRVIRRAHGQGFDAQLILHGGDLVNIGDSDTEWGDWFGKAGWVHGSAPCLAVPGNHEYTTPEGDLRGRLTPYWEAQFRTRPTGMEDSEDLRGAAWVVDWQGVRFVGLNSMREIARQAEWLDKEALANNPNRWTVVMFHHPIHSCVRTRDNPVIRALWEPILDKHRVDLVLQGHDHAYSRSGKVQGSELRKDDEPGRVYLTSVSGTKMYRINPERTELFQKLLQDRQMFHVGSVKGDVLRFESWMADGTLFEAFELHKQENGETVLKSDVPTA
jgi:hypothetical protein